MQNNDISEIMNMEKPNISSAVYILFQHSQPSTASGEKFIDATKTESIDDNKVEKK